MKYKGLILSLILIIGMAMQLFSCTTPEQPDEDIITEYLIYSKDELTFSSINEVYHIPVTSVYDSSKLYESSHFMEEYVDKDQNSYYFLKDTDDWIGFSRKRSGYEEGDIGLEKAMNIAEDYLSTVLEDFDGYELTNVWHDERNYQYVMHYTWMLNGIMTDDTINIRVSVNGMINSFARPGTNRFRGLNIDMDIVSNLPVIENIVTEFLTISPEGIILVKRVSVQNGDSHSQIVEKTYLVGTIENP